MEPDCICANATMWRTKKLMYFHRSNCDLQANIKCCYRNNCDGQRNTRVAIAKIVTDQSCYFDQCDGLIVAIVTIGTENCCYRNTVTDTRRRLRDGQLTETFYCSTYFFLNLLSRFYDFLFATLSKKGPEMLQLQLLWMHHCEIDVTIALMSVTNLMLLIYLE